MRRLLGDRLCAPSRTCPQGHLPSQSCPWLTCDPDHIRPRPTHAGGKCSACRDKPKFGGLGTAKQACILRRCAQPVMPTMGHVAPWLRQGSEALRKESRVGPEYQAELPRQSLPSARPFPAAPPHCGCALPAVWWRKRWWCHVDEPRACEFELAPPPFDRTPLCDCGEPAAWEARTEEWCCVRVPSAGGCGLASPLAQGPRPQSPLVECQRTLEIAHASAVAARLTAAAFNPDEPSVPPEYDDDNHDDLGLEEDDTCQVCGSGDSQDVLLLCDGEGCSAAMHTFCLTPPLVKVPKGEWYCTDCKAPTARTSGQRTASSSSAARSAPSAPSRPEAGAGRAAATAEAGGAIARQEGIAQHPAGLAKHQPIVETPAWPTADRPVEAVVPASQESGEIAGEMASAGRAARAPLLSDVGSDLTELPPSNRGLPARAAAGKAVREARRVAVEEEQSDEESEAGYDDDGHARVRARHQKSRTPPADRGKSANATVRKDPAALRA